MKTEIGQTATLLLILSGMVSSCGESIPSLKGTSWKLAGFVDTQTGAFTEAEPQCDQCYTLVFDTDITASGYSFMNRIGLYLRPVIRMGIMTEVGDEHNGTVGLYYGAIQSVKSYTVKNGALKIFYNGDNNYLLYKPAKQ